MRRWFASMVAALACAGSAPAQETATPPPPPGEQRSLPRSDEVNDVHRQKAPPLSEEDAELVKELALLEQMDLVRNLELFEPDKDQPNQPQRQP